MTRNSLIALAILAAASAANAQSFASEVTCYNWQGGDKSAGSFSKCRPDVIAAAPAPKPVAVVAPAAVAPSPVMMPVSCPPATPVPVQRSKPKPKPKKC